MRVPILPCKSVPTVAHEIGGGCWRGSYLERTGAKKRLGIIRRHFDSVSLCRPWLVYVCARERREETKLETKSVLACDIFARFVRNHWSDWKLVLWVLLTVVVSNACRCLPSNREEETNVCVRPSSASLSQLCALLRSKPAGPAVKKSNSPARGLL